MHISDEQLDRLADAYVKERLLDDRQMKIKKHMAQCDRCYERFCIRYSLLKSLKELKLLPAEAADGKIPKLCLVIRQIGAVISVVAEKKEELPEYWDFFRMPALAASRGGKTGEEIEIYKNRFSEYSCVKFTEKQVTIQLDGDVFPAGRLKARVCFNGKEEEYDFLYDRDTECYQVVLEREVLSENGTIEVFEV